MGAVFRVTPIKDVKTLIQAFAFAKMREPALKLWIMGSCEEEPEYAAECRMMAEMMGVTDIEFTGNIDVREYYGRMDMMILTSISEGQPLTILESFAAHKPVIATDVGNCRGLIEGEQDDLGSAGIITHIMNVGEIARAIISMARQASLRQSMGEIGYQRVMARYRTEYMLKNYREIYKDFAASMGLLWEDENQGMSVPGEDGKG